VESSTESLQDKLTELRRRLEKAFAPDTAAPGYDGRTASTGHCAAVAIIIHVLLGADLISTVINGRSHWLNRIRAGGCLLDVDVTGDQLGAPPIQVRIAGQLYADVRARNRGELTDETLARAQLLAHRAGLAEAERAIRDLVRHRACATRG
jgi:hypothetical protein